MRKGWRKNTVRRLVDYPPPTPQPTPCRIWQGALHCSKAGYGQRHDSELIHRWAWRMAYGPIPDGLWVLHKCDNRLCFRVEHLFLGTNGDNIRDMVAKGRANRSNNAKGAEHPHARLTEAQAREIRMSHETATALARRFGVDISTACRIRKGESWKHLADG